MNTTLIETVLLVWVPVVAILFRVIGPGRASLVAVLGGMLFLPTGSFHPAAPAFPVTLDKWNATGLGLILGVLIFDFSSLRNFRPHWLDLPMVIYYLLPLVGLVTGVPGASADILDVMIGRGLGWVTPYFLGRLYFSQADGPRKVAVAVMISGLSYIPFCVFEEFAGPSWYLGGLIYRIPCEGGMVSRLGGWRPEVFLGNGIALATWMAISTVIALWLWLGGGWKPRKWPAWLPALALLLTTLSCRGVYGYLILAIGLISVALTLASRSRVFLLVLATLPLVYLGARGSGRWDGMDMVRAASFTGRQDTIEFRLAAEDEIIHAVLDRNRFFGQGNYIWHGDFQRWPDGNWLHAFWMGGLVGLGLHLLALFVLPATLALAVPGWRPDRRQAMSPRWGLAACSILLMIDGMHNTSYFPPVALFGGTLVGTFLIRKSIRFEAPPSQQASRSSASKPQDILSPTLLIVVAGWILIEILGQIPRRPDPEFPAKPSEAVAPAEPSK